MGKMARSELHTTDRVVDILRVFLVVQTLQYCLSCLCVAQSHNQAFIQTDNHLTYIDGDLASGIPLEISPGNTVLSDFRLQDDNFYSNGIRLDPPMLDFDEQPVGMPRMEKVIVQNTDSKNSLHLLSISGSTVHFHCSFFQDKTVPPGGNTTFDVVFLARQVGNVENTLYIHTSVGSLKYQVFGVGIPNPYRLRPYLGARVPINSSFSPVIQMHNPHSSKIQVLEMFSSEGDLHLELPSGEKEATQELWEIRPYETKNVMKANFVGRVESNHTAFIRIKTDHDSRSQLLILPVEVEFSSEPGIYSPVEMIDFGIMRTLDDPRTMPVRLINTGVRAVHITSVSAFPPNDAISIDFRPLKLQPDGSRQYTVAHVTFRAVKAVNCKQWSGKILVKTKNNQQKLVIPYQASILHGSLVYNTNATNFFSPKVLKNFTRPLTLTNTFNFSVVVYNVSLPLEATPYFSVINFTLPVIIGRQQTLTPLALLFHPNDTQIHLSTTLSLYTNASTFLIPLVVYNGLLKVVHHRPERSQGQLDFGTMGVGETRSMIYTVRNNNPVDLVMARFETNVSWVHVEVLGIEKGNGTTLTHPHNISSIKTDPLIIKPYHYAVFSITIVAPQEEGAYAAEVWMYTQFEYLSLPITFRTAEGSLHAIPEKFVFEKVFPGKIPFKVLQIRSTFHDNMEVTQVLFQPQDIRFYFQPQSRDSVYLQPQEASVVGKIFFDPKKECRDDCYVGLPTVTPAGHQWLLGLTLDKDVADTDQYLFTRLQQKFNRLDHSGQNIVNVTIELDTNQVKGFLFSAQSHLHWPSLVRKSRLKFPLTQIGNITVSDFIVENLADTPILMQVLPLSLYPNPHTVIDLFSQGLSSDLTDYLETDDLDTFRLYDLENTVPGSTSPVLEHIQNVESTLGVIPHKQSIAAILQPGGKLKVKIGFLPRDDLARSSLILIRNNLTIMDAVIVTGQGCNGEMKFSNRKPGSQSPLSFELTEKHLKNCEISEKKSSKTVVPHFTVRRTFTLRNTGELPFYVRGFSINESPCEGYGFKVLDCDGFEIQPNSSKKIDIAFTPDFTMSRIRRMLTIHTSLGPSANYTLQATVPPNLLSRCSAVLPRPYWEPVLYYSIVCLMSFLLLCICIAAYFEGDRIIVSDIINRKLKVSNATQTFDKGKVFDLRNVAGLGISSSKPVSPPVSSSFSSSALSSSSPAGQDLRTAAAKSMIHINGHVEYHQTTNSHQPFLNSVMSIMKRCIPRNLFYSTPKSTVSFTKQASPPLPQAKLTADIGSTSISPGGGKDSGKKESEPVLTKNTSKSRSSPDHKPQPHQQAHAQNLETACNSEKVCANGAPRTLKRSKPTKRHLAEGVNCTLAVSGEHLDSKNIKDATLLGTAKKMTDGENDVKVASPEVADDYLDLDSSPKADSSTSKSAGKTQSRKTKGKNNAERDLQKDKCVRRHNSVPDDKDETSSTTTDSSVGGDQEDKQSSNAHDSTPEPVIPINFTIAKKSKKNRHDRVVAAVLNGEVNDDDNFELTSKSKAHRKIRVNPKIYGGDIMKPSTLDLPYTLPKEKDKTENVTAPEPSRRSKKPRNQAKSDFLLHTVHLDDYDRELEPGRDSPPPAWDQPAIGHMVPGSFGRNTLSLSLKGRWRRYRTGDLSELSIQTENFAQQIGRSSTSGSTCSSGGGGYAGPPSGSHSPDFMSASSGSSSYSSIVSSTSIGPSPVITSTAIGGTLDGGNTTLPTRLGVKTQSLPILGDAARFQGFHPFPDTMGLPSLTLPKPSLPSVTSGGSGGTWSSMPPAPCVPSLGNNFGLQTIDESASAMFGMQPADIFGSAGDSLYPQYGDSMEPIQQPQNLTMMQQLQAERRQRIRQHQMRMKKDDWPGFDVPPVQNDSLWDNDYNPLDPLTNWAPAAVEPSPAPLSGLWSTLQTFANIWSPSAQPAVVPPSPAPPQPLQPSPAVSAAQLSSPVSPLGAVASTTVQNSVLRPDAPPFTTAAESAANFANPIHIVSAPQQSQITGAKTFSPFSTPMADIWKPASQTSISDSTWGQFLPPMKEDK